MSTLPTLYHKGKKGQLYSWRVWVEGADIVTEYGTVDGQKQLARKTAEAKNVGRSNATTPEQQAAKEAVAMHQHKLERKYSLTPEDASEPLMLPMLAQDFEKRKKKLADMYPVWVQPKLDGIRCLAKYDEGIVTLTSRSGKEFHLPHISRQLARVMDTYFPTAMLDGELYIHGESFQTITSYVKKYRPGITETVCFHAYDVIYEDMHQGLRMKHLGDLKLISDTLEWANPNIKAVQSEVAWTEGEVYEKHVDFILQGYEGSMVRVRDGMYQFGYRSDSLLKVKNFVDDEFEVVGYETGVGKFADAVIWTCVTKDGKRFNVTPQGTMEERRAFLKDADAFVGELLKVKFFELTKDGIPRFPVGLGFRMQEDISLEGAA